MIVAKAEVGTLRIGLICFSAIPDDPRVRRQGDLFHGHGWDVVAIGLPGARSPLPKWRCLDPGSMAIITSSLASAEAVTAGGELEKAIAAPPNVEHFAGHGWRNAAKRAWQLLPSDWRRLAHTMLSRVILPFFRRVERVYDLARVYVNPRHADKIYWKLNDRFDLLYRLAKQERVDVWLANDWTVLPIGRRLAAEQGVSYAYDTHELAVDEYAHRLRWRLTQRPVIAAIERDGIAGSAVTSCVSQGIADRLHELYQLPEQPLLIRNMPRYEAHPFRPSGDTIEVLYHGVVNVGRGLEACIDSVALWRTEFRLTIRGPGPAEYLEALAARIMAAGLGERVTLAPPVPMTDLVRQAAHFDVGLFALPGHSKQNVHVLPNKFFEYTMAGLALCVSDLPEMTALLRRHDLGRLIPDVTPQAIAAAVNGFDRVSIDIHKRHALEAAKTLNWEAEADRLFAAIEEAVSAARAKAAA